MVFFGSLISLLFFAFPVAGAEKISIVTESLPPYQIQGNQKEVSGMATEIVRAVLKEAGMQGDIRMYPWARAYKIALYQKNVLIYSIMRTRQRENFFKWVGVITPFDIYLHKLKSRTDVTVNSLEDCKKYLIGVVKDNAEDHYFMSKRGFRTELSGNDILNIEKLLSKRVDLIPFNENMLSYRMKTKGHDVSEVEKLIHLPETSADIYMAFNKNTPDSLVEKFRNAFDKIKKSGKYDSIRNKYLQTGGIQ
ncbi:MAG: transporter substrate-binding domain-containing protein [Desulfobacteraceae bacterium]|nr:transporter substrate-binding domain-containing protein [Desulfobacteraceae bacterium]